MHEWIDKAIASPQTGITLLAALMLLGMLSAVASSCCNLPVIGAIAGYAGTDESNKRRDVTVTALSFAAGSVLVLGSIGAAMGWGGQLVGDNFGRYSRLVVGLVLVVFGLISLGLFPFRLPSFRLAGRTNTRGVLGALVLGSTLGGASAACAVSCCSPALFGVLGVVALRGQVAKGAVLMATFGLGYSIPLVAVILGAGLGRWALRANKVMPAVKLVAGVLLIGVGFYFLATA